MIDNSNYRLQSNASPDIGKVQPVTPIDCMPTGVFSGGRQRRESPPSLRRNLCYRWPGQLSPIIIFEPGHDALWRGWQFQSAVEVNLDATDVLQQFQEARLLVGPHPRAVNTRPDAVTSPEKEEFPRFDFAEMRTKKDRNQRDLVALHNQYIDYNISNRQTTNRVISPSIANGVTFGKIISFWHSPRSFTFGDRSHAKRNSTAIPSEDRP